MKTKQLKKVTSIFIAILIISLTTTVFALRPDEVDVDGEFDDGGTMQEFGEKALGIIQIVGIVGSVLILMVAGIKYMTGSVEEKADYKKALMPYLVGAILLFGATTIANMVYQMANTGNSQSDNVLGGGAEVDDIIRPWDPNIEQDTID